MFKRALLTTLAVSTALMISACNSTTTTTKTDPSQSLSDAPFIDEGVKAMYRDLSAAYQTKYFALGIPSNWKVVSFEDEERNSHISVERADRSASVTIRVKGTTQSNVEESCTFAINSFKANNIKFTKEPGVSFGTCLIEGTEDNKPMSLWLRNYNDVHLNYSISFNGDLNTVTEVLGYLVGDERLMQLLVRPL